MRYYISRSSSTVPKNKAQAHIQEFIRQFFNMAVNSDEDLNGLIERIKKEVEETNALYGKCSPMKVDVQNYRESDAIDIWITPVTNGIPSICTAMHAHRVYRVYGNWGIDNLEWELIES